MAIDTLALARTMQRMAAAIDAHCRPAAAVQRTFDAAPFGSAHICISPGEESQYASSNRNRIHLCGTAGGLTRDGLAQLCRRFEEAGVGRFFVWLTPGPDMDAVRGWLAEAGMARHPHVTYPTLARMAGTEEPVSTDVEVRELAAGDAARTLPSLEGASSPDFRRLVGAPGFSTTSPMTASGRSEARRCRCSTASAICAWRSRRRRIVVAARSRR